MFLYVARHAEAASAGPFADADRPLTAAGEAQATWLGTVLSRLDARPEIVVCSPVRRCRDTATLAAEALGLPPQRVRAHDALAGNHDVAGILHAVAGVVDAPVVLLVGHAPDVEALTSALLSGSTAVHLRFRVACCAGLQLDALPPTGPGVLHWFIGPDLMRTDPAAR